MTMNLVSRATVAITFLLLSHCVMLLNQPVEAQSARVVKSPPALNSSGYYTSNRAPLQGLPFQKLPPGAVTPRGWLRHQLELDAQGLVGRMAEISDFVKIEESGWVDPKSNVGWEEVAYWLRGYGDLGYVLSDPTILVTTRKWVNGILSNQKPDGYFGPDKLRTALDGKPDLWPHMLMLDALHSYYEYSGDKRVIPFMSRYFKWQATVPVETFRIGGWRASRWADNINVIHWLYNQTGDSALLDLVKKIHENSANFVNNLPTAHNVNLAQGIREPGQFWMQSGEAKHLEAVENNYQELMGHYGQFPSGGFAGDENLRHAFVDPRQGFETCGFVEFMHTHEMMTRITGNPVWADRTEEIAFNSLPAALTPDHKGIHYITSANMVKLDRGVTTGQFDNRWSMLEFEPAANTYRCCPHNVSMGWPYYVEESWLATSDKGVAASLYGASQVKVKVGDGTAVTWSQTTDYPFADTIDFKLSTPKTVQFPFYLRIPRWAKNAPIRVNGAAVKVTVAPLSYVVLDRSWKEGDTVSLRLPMQVELRQWPRNKNSVSVDYGPLNFGFNPDENWVRTGGTPEWPNLAVSPVGAWNYGLPQGVKATDFKVVRKAGNVSKQPFTLQSAPLTLQTKARRVPGWDADARGIVRPLQASPALSGQPLETITLVPLGAARLRIASFPTVSSSAQSATDWRLGIPKDYAVTASHVSDDPEALIDGIEPKNSGDYEVPRFTFWNHLGTSEWVSLDLKKPGRVSGVSLYWFDDTGQGQCRVPASWRLLYRDGESWKPVTAPEFGTTKDTYNTVKFSPVATSALRIEVQLQDGFSGGILEWRVGGG